jgi:hypothetical protein
LELAEGIDDAGPELGAIDEPFDDDGMEVKIFEMSEEGLREGLELAEGIELGEADENCDDLDTDAKDLEATEGVTEGFELADGCEDVRIELLEKGEIVDDDADTEGNELGWTEEGGAEGLEPKEGIDDAELAATDEALEDARLEAEELGRCVILEEGADGRVDGAAETDEITADEE